MKLSIITSLYKSEKFLPTFIRKVQKVHNELLENNISFNHLFITNDPNTEEISVLGKIEKDNIKILETPLESLYSSWNRGIRESDGEIITFWNVDDKRNIDAIIDGINILKDKNINLVYFPFVYKRYIKIFNIPILVKVKKINPPEFNRKIFSNSMHCGPFFMFRRELLEKVGNFDDNFKIAGDFDWCIRASKIGKFKKSNKIAGTFYNYGDSLSGSKDLSHQKENEKIYKKYNVIK